MKKNVYQIIGFAQKAGQVSSGTMAAKTSLLRKRARLLIMAEDISETTKESLVTTCQKQNIPWLLFGDKYRLGTCIGKAYRVAVTINDDGFARAILEALETGGDEANLMGVVKWQK
ncbi:MAG: 50S ribosomal protein L7ae [Syntrophomonadaceae bacterium]|nr:50S ribosomal protein L7ae [Syntrophomonadaceae bacterium]